MANMSQITDRAGYDIYRYRRDRRLSKRERRAMLVAAILKSVQTAASGVQGVVRAVREEGAEDRAQQRFKAWLDAELQRKASNTYLAGFADYLNEVMKRENIKPEDIFKAKATYDESNATVTVDGKKVVVDPQTRFAADKIAQGKADNRLASRMWNEMQAQMKTDKTTKLHTPHGFADEVNSIANEYINKNGLPKHQAIKTAIDDVMGMIDKDKWREKWQGMTPAKAANNAWYMVNRIWDIDASDFETMRVLKSAASMEFAQDNNVMTATVDDIGRHIQEDPTNALNLMMGTFVDRAKDGGLEVRNQDIQSFVLPQVTEEIDKRTAGIKDDSLRQRMQAELARKDMMMGVRAVSGSTPDAQYRIVERDMISQAAQGLAAGAGISPAVMGETLRSQGAYAPQYFDASDPVWNLEAYGKAIGMKDLGWEEIPEKTWEPTVDMLNPVAGGGKQVAGVRTLGKFYPIDQIEKAAQDRTTAARKEFTWERILEALMDRRYGNEARSTINWNARQGNE